MSIMSEIATELELYWQQANVGCYWSRKLPNGQVVTISSWTTPHMPSDPGYRSGFHVTVDHERVADVDHLAGALSWAGSIARAQLAERAMTWAAIGLSSLPVS